MRRVDREALQRALRLTRAEPAHVEQIARKFEDGDESWEEVAKFCAYCQQRSALQLRPWESPPCALGDEKPVDDHAAHGRVAAWELRRRLIAYGLSMYEPDPIRALHAIEEDAKQTAAS